MVIAVALKAKGYEIDRRKIALRDAIKETGEHTVNVKLHREVSLPLAVTVTAEGGEVEAAAADEKPKRGRKKAAAEDAPADTAGAETSSEE